MKLELTPNEVATLELLIIEEMQELEKRILFYGKVRYAEYLKVKLAELKAVKEKLSNVQPNVSKKNDYTFETGV